MPELSEMQVLANAALTSCSQETVVKRDLAKREWDAEKRVREIVRDELHTAALVSGENAKLIFELVLPSEIKAEILAGEAQLHIHDRDDKLIYVVTAFDIREGE